MNKRTKEEQTAENLAYISGFLIKNGPEKANRRDYPQGIEDYIQQLVYEAGDVENMICDLEEAIKLFRSRKHWISKLAIRCAMDQKRYLKFNEWLED